MRYQVTLDNAKSCGVLDLQGSYQALSHWPSATNFTFPELPNTFVTFGPQTLYWVGRQHWLLRTELAQEQSLLALANKPDIPDEVSVVQVSDSLSFLRIRGPDADQVLSIASPLDIHKSVFPENGASYSEAFGIKALVIRCADGFELAVDRSYLDMIEDYLTRAVGITE